MLRRWKKWWQVRDDPQHGFRIGRLLGSTELMGHVMVRHTDPQVQQFGRLLLAHCERFWQEGDNGDVEQPETPSLAPPRNEPSWLSPDAGVTRIDSSEQVTGISPPRA